ncbi:MAG: beta-ketoacyl-ACP synthase II [Deltaproteobacteria bacterium]|nr:beta-ketoacyl-ACP synthase II [Deltaproteobacteria bacterium]MBW1952154.1 beta-ketoacyl-ACP synthase II [Deltaproteobacteria bacterium]MBW1986157.1 beta-ketoacyl-ACP synthase II [Deltaproteobacteria bacterium]MBW2134911.1 beta-ketoacyl-ACP synthase II [Deltaproteobacteria bacterium]
MSARVVITGLGLITPLGIGVEPSWQNLLAGKSGIGPITRFPSDGFDTTIAGEVPGFKPEDFIPAKLARRTDLFSQFALAAAVLAVQDAGLEITPELSPQVGTIVGCGLGGLNTLEKYHTILLDKGPRKVSPFFIPMLIANMAPGLVAMHFGARGPNTSTVTACASGAHAIGDAFKIIQRGSAKVMITGGVEAVITPLAIAGFNAMKALSTRNDEPQRASRPFDRDRDGFVVGEGGGILVLEELEFARRREAKIYGEIIGYGMSGDAYHMTAPSPDGAGAVLCVEQALEDARISIDEVDYINAHGTSTPLNDLSETLALKKVFGPRAYQIPISATKSMTGHLLGGAGAIEAVFTVLSLQQGILPPTINYENPDPQCDLDYVPNQPREMPVRIAMSNSFGFGGTNAVLVLKRFE